MDDLLKAFDAAIADELPRVSAVEYNSHEICKHFADKVRARIQQRLDSSGWMPIETAPKDGTKIVAEWTSRSKGSVPIIIGTEYYISRRDGDEFWWPRIPLPDGFKPKRWQPLPDLPRGE